MLSLAVLLAVQTQMPRAIPYYDPLGRKPSTYEDYVATQVDAPFDAEVVSRVAPGGRDTRLVIVFVNAGLYPAIESDLSTYLADLAAAGFTTKLITVSGGRPQNLRQVLQAHRDSALVGGLMVGDLPVAWWEDSDYGEDYPIDIFFTDLDGTFGDADADGKYDSHSGNAAPDIWLGRVYASRSTYEGEEQLTRSFFQRNHLYRTGQLAVPHRGLVYNEVSWYPNDHGMSDLYSNVTMFNDENTTAAFHYKSQLRLGYEFVHIICHSSPWVHSFFLANDEPGAGSLFAFELPALGPNAAFYFVNGCMCGRFTEKDNLSCWYLFSQPWAQVVMASAQLMYGVSDLSDVYGALGRDSCVGDAFLKWHRSNYPSFLGTCILGDPTVKVNRTTPPMVRVNPPDYWPSAPLHWIEHTVENSNFVNGNPAIGFSQGRIRVVFDSGRRVRSDTYFSSFDGFWFTPAESIAWHEYYDLFPASCTDATGRFWVVWQSFRDYASYEHFQIFSSYYYNGAWSSLSRVGAQAGYHDVQAAVASGTDNRVWCAFKSWRNGQADIWVSYEDNAGAWATPVRLTSDSLDQIDPCVVVDRQNHAWVFWSSLADGRWRIQGREYVNGWQPAFDLDTTGANGHPRAAVDADNRVWVVWHKWQGNQSDIYYVFHSDSAWTTPAPLAADSTDDLLPDIASVPGGTVWACWQSRRDGRWDIYTSHYADGWTEPDPVTNDTANDCDPVVCADSSGSLWTAWASDRRGYWNIYAAANPLTGTSAQPVARPVAFNVSPNPFFGQVAFSGPTDFSVDVYAIDGRKLTHLTTRSGRTAWSPPNLAAGVYVAHLAGASGRSTVRMIHVE